MFCSRIGKLGKNSAGDGILGLVAVEATADAPAAAVLGRIALGPGTVEASTDRDPAWRCGPLTVKFFDNFGTGSVERVPQYARAPETWWPGVQLRQNLDGGAKSGQRFVYSVWIGPQGAEPPMSMRLLPQDRGWLATWPAGRQAAAVFNPTPAPLTIDVPWSATASPCFCPSAPTNRLLWKRLSPPAMSLVPAMAVECAGSSLGHGRVLHTR